MPQLNQLMFVYQSQWFWLLLCLALIYIFIGRGMVPKIENVVEDRNARIQSDLDAAERAHAEADEAEEQARTGELQARGQAQSVIADAKAAAAEQTEAALASADAKVAEKLSAAEASIAEARAQAVSSLESVAAEAARDVVAKVSGVEVSADQAAATVKAVLADG
ncbi:MAG: ATPase [Novosphingobium sp.]|nr:ATPase [Novosphingobium sp.]